MSVLVVSDLDGTLLRNNEKASQHTIDVLNQSIDQGLCFTVATARSWITASRTIEGLSLSLPAVVYNGAALMDTVRRRPMQVCRFSLQQREQIAILLREQEISPIVYSFLNGRETFSFLPGTMSPGMKEFLDSRKNDPRLRPVSNWQSLLDGDVFYFNCIDEKEKTAPLAKMLEADCHVIFAKDYYTDFFWLELMPNGVSKAAAVLCLKEMYAFDRLIVFGDGKNDLELFQIADEAYAPENADPALKEIATAVILNNEEDGVALFLEENRIRWRDE